MGSVSDPDPHHLAGSGIRIVVQENLKSTIFTFWNIKQLNIIQNNEEKKLNLKFSHVRFLF